MTESSDAPIPFEPVPANRARHDGWSEERQRVFIDQLARIGLVSAAARAVGMSTKSAYALRKRAGAESFAAAWDEAVGIGRFAAELTAIDRAFSGEARPVFYNGRKIGERIIHDNRLLLAVLRTRVYPKRTRSRGDVP